MSTTPTGHDRNFYKEVSVSSATFTPAEDVLINVKGVRNLLIENYGAGVVEYSFNGTVLHGRVGAAVGAVPTVKSFQGRSVAKIWFRSVSGTNVVRVESW